MTKINIVRFHSLFLVSIITFLALSPSVNASGTLFGQVYGIDRTNTPAPFVLNHANVTISANGKVIQSISVSGFNAYFTANLPPGWYDVKAECVGFVPQSKRIAISDGHASELYFYLERTSNSTGSTTTLPTLSVGLVSPPSPSNGATVALSSVTFDAQVISGGLAVQNATVSIYVDGSLVGSGYSDSNGYYSISHSVTESGHTYSWYATASKPGYVLATSSTFTFVYTAQSVTSTTSTSTASSYGETTTMTSVTPTLTATTVSVPTTFITTVVSTSTLTTSDYTPTISTQTAVAGSTSTTFADISTTTTETTSASTTSYSIPLSPSCLIATAAYGSPLSPQVQALRNFRDQLVLKTFAGSQFMKAFNAWYYSFSPSIAHVISKSPSLAAVVRILIYPLVGILQVAAAAHTMSGSNSQLKVVITGFLASSLIGLVYDTPWITALFITMKKKYRFEMKLHYLVPFAGGWVASLVVIGIAGFFTTGLLMMLATAAFVLLTIGLSATITAFLIAKVYAARSEN
jgi:hypothetical protein